MKLKSEETGAARLEKILGGLIEEKKREDAAALARVLDDPDCLDPERWLLLAQQAALAEDWDLAETRLGRSLELGSENPRVMFEMAKVLWEKGDDAQAVAWAEKVISKIPQIPYGYFLLAEIHSSKGRTDEAAAVLRKIMNSKRFEDDVRRDARKGLAEILMKARRFDDAVPLYRKAVEMESEEAGLWTDYGHCLSRLGDAEGALEAFEKAAGLKPDAQTLYNLGDCLIGLGRNKEAIAFLGRAARVNPDHAMTNYDLGLAFYNERRYEEGAAASLRTLGDDVVMEYQSSNPGLGATINLGLCLMEQGHYKDALACFDSGIAAVLPVFFNKGLTYYRMRRPKDAIAWFKKVLEIDPEDKAALNLMGQALDEDGKFAEAVACLKKALRIDPKYALGYYDLGVILGRKKGKEMEAMRCFKKALALGLKEPFPAQARYSIACLHAVAGRKKESLKELEAALREGYDDKKHIAADKDWDRLRKDPDFKAILQAHFGKKA